MSVTPQTNEPAVPEELSDQGDTSSSIETLFAAPVESVGSHATPSPEREVPVDRPPAGQVVDETRLEARVVERLVRHVSPWSVLKVSTLLYLSMYVVFLLAGIGLWWIASSRGLIGSLESFMDELLAEEDFQVNGSQVLRIGATIGIFGVVIASAMTVLFSIIFNLISDITGGVRFSVVELETARPRRVRRRS